MTSQRVSTHLFQALLICSIAAIFYCYEYYLRVMPSVLVYELMEKFNLNYARFGLFSALFYWAYMPVQVPVGLMLDKYGPRLVLTFACFLCALGTYLFGCSNTFWIVAAGRFLIGLGSAFAFVGFLKICNNWLPQKYYAFMVGLCMFLGTVGAMGGEVVCAYMMQFASFEQIAIYSAYVGMALTIIIYMIIRNQPSKDIMQIPLQNYPQVPLKLALVKALKSKQVWILGTIGFSTYLPLSFFAELWAVPFLQASGYTREIAATTVSMIFLGFGIGGPIFGALSEYYNCKKSSIIIGSITCALISLIIIRYPLIGATQMATLMFLLGAFSSCEILVFALGNEITQKNTSSTVIAVINMTIMLGGIIMQPIIGSILDLELGIATLQKYKIALLSLPMSLLLAAFLTTKIDTSKSI